MNREKFYPVVLGNDNQSVLLGVLHISILTFVLRRFIKILKEEGGSSDMSKILLGILAVVILFSLVLQIVKFFRKKGKENFLNFLKQHKIDYKPGKSKIARFSENL